jgi:uncharacterized repeat protein (TIGR02543 family)
VTPPYSTDKKKYWTAGEVADSSPETWRVRGSNLTIYAEKSQFPTRDTATMYKRYVGYEDIDGTKTASYDETNIIYDGDILAGKTSTHSRATPMDGNTYAYEFPDSPYISKSGWWVEIPADVEADVEVIFKRIPRFTVVFNANGGEGSMDSQLFTYGKAQSLRKNSFTKEGYVFAGWSAKADGEVQLGDEDDGSEITATAGKVVTAYAIWVRPNITITNATPELGSISLFSTSDNKIVATQGTDNVLAWQGNEGWSYRVVAEPSDDLYEALGAEDNGNYLEPYQFTLGAAPVNKNYYFREKELFSITFNNEPEGNTASVTSPSAPDKDGKYVEGQAITVTGSPAPGYKLKAANVFNSDTNLPIGDFDNIENNTFTIDKIFSNLRIVCVFVKVDYSIDVIKDEKSADVISDVTAMMGDTHIVTATYGDVVTFAADVVDGYSFGGWYADGVLVSEANPYDHTVTGNTSLVAKAKVAISLGISYEDNREDTATLIKETCTLAVNGKTVKVPHDFDVVLGESFSYVLTLGALIVEGETWKFDAWYSGNTKLQYRKDDTVTPIAALSMTAKVTSAPIQRTLSISFVHEESPGNAIIVSEDAVKISPEPASINVEGSTVSFVIDGTQEVQLKFIDEIQSTETLAFSEVVIGETEIADSIFNYFVNDNISATAYYGSTGNRTTSIDFADDSDRTMGEITIDDKSSEDEPMPIAIEKNRGGEVQLTARLKNGYKFVGWYISSIGIGNPYKKDASISLKVTTNRTLFAKFVQDPNAVYEWEGSNENKIMVWRSKTYEASKPFNPSACRVDTTGYPVASLSVEMFSAPDRAPTAVANLTNVKSQNARRLPIRRMERYMQVAVRNDEEVDTILVGTSMGGLAV